MNIKTKKEHQIIRKLLEFSLRLTLISFFFRKKHSNKNAASLPHLLT